MGKELEYKLGVPDEVLLARILEDEKVASLLSTTWQETQMKTTYYDAPDRRFGRHHITLRQRFEDEESIVCVKTPTKESHTRGEWQIEAAEIDDEAIERLIRLGAPLEISVLFREDVAPICGARFTRRHAMLTFPDGTMAEIAGDHGILHGQSEEESLTELELELYEGEAAPLAELVDYLCRTYDLHEQPMSKYARARALK
ncbi:MAG: CYTH domain-containing protein [Ruminococcaceae bacterium]|nr:CYTH domain-containing protein [Oscillospiraceae bacterium]